MKRSEAIKKLTDELLFLNSNDSYDEQAKTILDFIEKELMMYFTWEPEDEKV